MFRYAPALLMGLLLAGAPAARADDPQEESAPARPLPQIIAELGIARDMETATALYSEGRRVDRDSVLLHQAFLKRALLLGRPSVAFHAAGDLTRLTPNDAAPWSVMAYVHARRGKMLWALTSAMQAISLTDRDPSVLQNAANLLAWYDSQDPPPKLAPQGITQIQNERSRWDACKPFHTAYKTAREAFDNHAREAVSLQKDIDKLAQEYRTLRDRRTELDGAFRRDQGALNDYEKRLARVRQMIRNRQEESRNNADGNKHRDWKDRNDTFDKDVRNYKKKIHHLKNKNNARRKEAAKLAEKQTQASTKANKLRQDLRVHLMTPPELTWTAPTIDGKPIEDLELQSATQPASKPEPVASQPWTPPSNETRMKMARMFLRNNRPWKALELLEAVIKESPDSESAQEAAQIIDANRLKR